jgi:hypothetical protein
MSNSYESDSEYSSADNSPKQSAQQEPQPPPPLNLVPKSPFLVATSKDDPAMSPIVQWATYDSTHTFKYDKFSLLEKIKLFDIISKYFIYCNTVDKKTFELFVGTSNNQFKNIIYCLFLWGGKPEWKEKTYKRMNYPLFLNEYFAYIKTVSSSEKDSFDVNTIMKPLHYNSNRNILRDNRNKIFHNILTKYVDEFGTDYDITKIQDFGISIYVKEMNMNPEKITKYTITAIFKKFTQYVAGLTEDEFPEIKKIHNSPGFLFPREFYTMVDVVSKPTIKESVKNRKRKEVELLNIQPSEKRPKIDNLATSAKTLVSFMKNISKEAESKQDIALIKMLIEKNSKESIAEAVVVQEPMAQASVPKKKDFIKTLPFYVFKILKEKGGVDLAGFIKPVKLTSEEELSINSTEILLSLYENGLII